MALFEESSLEDMYAEDEMPENLQSIPHMQQNKLNVSVCDCSCHCGKPLAFALYMKYFALHMPGDAIYHRILVFCDMTTFFRKSWVTNRLINNTNNSLLSTPYKGNWLALEWYVKLQLLYNTSSIVMVVVICREACIPSN